MIILKTKMYISFIILGILTYFLRMCYFMDCKQPGIYGYKHALPISGFYEPFLVLFSGKGLMALKMFVSVNNPWIYMFIALFIINIVYQKGQNQILYRLFSVKQITDQLKTHFFCFRLIVKLCL